MMSRTNALSGPSLPLRAILWLFALLTVFPFGLLLLTSLKSQADLLRGAFVLPDRPHFENFLSAWVDGHFVEEVAFLQALVRVPTDTPPGNNAPHADRTAELLKPFGFAKGSDYFPILFVAS